MCAGSGSNLSAVESVCRDPQKRLVRRERDAYGCAIADLNLDLDHALLARSFDRGVD